MVALEASGLVARGRPAIDSLRLVMVLGKKDAVGYG